MGFCRQENWSRVPGAPPGDLPDPEIKLECLYICIGGQVHYLPLVLLGSPYIYTVSHNKLEFGSFEPELPVLLAWACSKPFFQKLLCISL